jgi:hypothetical protein
MGGLLNFILFRKVEVNAKKKMKVKYFINKMIHKFNVIRFWIKVSVQFAYIMALDPI